MSCHLEVKPPKMSETANSDARTAESAKPVDGSDEVIFPLFPDPKDDDFEDDISEEEKSFYKEKFPDINTVKSLKLHCTACDRHLGCAPRSESRMRSHPMLRTLMCNTCHTFYNSGEFEKGEDGSELYCRWCGQGGQVYCCSDCQHVFCAKCIKRNLGVSKIKEIEDTDDWKCFKCEPRCLWELRAVCWALLRFTDLRNKLSYSTQDPKLKEAYQKSLSLDESTCCKLKVAKKKVRDESRKGSVKVVDIESIKKDNTAAAIISKIPSTIQVKKFASMNADNSHKRPQKRPASPSRAKEKMAKNSLAQTNKFYSPQPHILNKKMRMMTSSMVNPIRIQPSNPTFMPFGRVTRPVTPSAAMVGNNFTGGGIMRHNGYTATNSFNQSSSLNQSNSFNNSFNSSNSYNNSGYNSMLTSDNINLSLEELTQGLDMAAVVAMATNNQQHNNDVVCTPDFPLEPLCEVTEGHNVDDDVECISGPKVSKPKVSSGLTPRDSHVVPDLSPENILQMTDNDVTVNPTTGGLKFRVDPQTLSSNKLYRLPDGRIFAINSNPSMPGGYSATIVAVSDSAKKPKAHTKGATYAARLSAVAPASLPTLAPVAAQNKTHKPALLRPAAAAAAPGAKPPPKPQRLSPIVRRQSDMDNDSDSNAGGNRQADLNAPIEWYRYNLIDAVDSLSYSVMRLKKLRKEATTTFLRTRTVNEMCKLHRDLERVLNTSCKRFQEIKTNLNDGLKSYIVNKTNAGSTISDDDDDVEILENSRNDDPICIDENSVDSVQEQVEKPQQVDLTEHDQSLCELNDSSDKSGDLANNTERDPFGDVNGTDKEDLSNRERATNEGKSKDDIVDPAKCSEDKTNDALDDLNKQSEDEDDGVDMAQTILGGSADSVSHSEQVDKAAASDSEDKTENKEREEFDPVVEKQTETVDGDKKANTNKDDDNMNVGSEAAVNTDINTENESVEEGNKSEDIIDNCDEDKSQAPDTEMTEDMIDNCDEDKSQAPDTEMTEDMIDNCDEDKSQAPDTEMTEDMIDNCDEDKIQAPDTEMTEDMIDNLLNDDLGDDSVAENLNLLDFPDLQEP